MSPKLEPLSFAKNSLNKSVKIGSWTSALKSTFTLKAHHQEATRQWNFQDTTMKVRKGEVSWRKVVAKVSSLGLVRKINSKRLWEGSGNGECIQVCCCLRRALQFTSVLEIHQGAPQFNDPILHKPNPLQAFHFRSPKCYKSNQFIAPEFPQTPKHN